MEYTLVEKYQLIKKDLLNIESTNPIEIAKIIMNKEYINIHGPEHHYLDGCAFLMAYYNCTNSIKIEESLDLLKDRSLKMPGAMCGLWGVCGSVTSIGAALSIIHNTSPLSNDSFYKEHMEYTSLVINKMSKVGGPRCCKRNAFIALEEACYFVKEKYGIILQNNQIKCDFSQSNKQCIGNKCPFNPNFSHYF